MVDITTSDQYHIFKTSRNAPELGKPLWLLLANETWAAV